MNTKVREAAKKHGIAHWSIAEALGISEYAFSRKLRHEFSDEYREEVISVIKKLAKEKGKCDGKQ